MRKFLIAGLAICLWSVAASGASTEPVGKVEKIGPASDASIPDTVKKVLEPNGYRIVLADGSVACEIWFRQGVATQKKADVEGVLYPQLAESALVGVIVFPSATTDYRGLPIKAGAYTLRYALLPNDGNHLGVAPNRDFLLLIPAASDSSPDAVLKFTELMNLSRQATGSRHPGSLNMAEGKEGPVAAVSEDQEGHWVFSTRLKLASGEEMPFGLIIKSSGPAA